MIVDIGYDKQCFKVEVQDKNVLGVLNPNAVAVNIKGVDAVKLALENPIGSMRLKDIVKKGETVCIITSDITRPMPSKLVLPPVIEELMKGGITENDITVVFALGNHRVHSEEEKKYLVGEALYQQIKCVDADQKRVKNLGITSRGTPVDIFEDVVNADRIICLGNIEYHYFAGYSGGAKAIMPGVSTAAAIQANHSRMVEPTSTTGKIEGNNLRADIEEAAGFAHIDFIVNVVLDEKKQVIKAVVGDYIAAHREGCAFLDTLYKVDIDKKADIVMVSPGGFPKDINLYQAQKALDNSKHAVKDGGVIILVASCKEGLGEKVFERWMLEAESPQSMIKQIKEKFELGGHKAAAIGMVQEKAEVYLVSEMDADFAASMFFKPFSHAQNALETAIEKMGDNADIIFMPYGGSTLPNLIGK